MNYAENNKGYITSSKIKTFLQCQKRYEYEFQKMIQ